MHHDSTNPSSRRTYIIQRHQGRDIILSDEIHEKYRRAGKIAAEARDYGASLIKEGALYIDIATAVETYITKQGAGIAFPVNISNNEIAAHYSPRHDDTLVFHKGDLIKLDVGSHVDGYIADTAVTVEVGTHQYDEMIAASSKALDNAIDHIKAGVDLSSIGEIIEQTIATFGYKPIDNLTGHSLQQYDLHSGISVPNIANSIHHMKPKVGDVLAIEPFATNGAGHVKSGQSSNIYVCHRSLHMKIIRDRRIKGAFQQLCHSFKTLPFAQRWCRSILQPKQTDQVLRKLVLYGLIKQYPQLIDAKQGMVTQKEHTLMITDEGCEVMT